MGITEIDIALPHNYNLLTVNWFITLAFIAVGIYGIWQINPFPPYASEVETISRIIGSIIWLGIFIGAAFASRKNGS